MHVMESFRLDGKVAVVTGGARDLGYDMAEALTEAGTDIIITSRTHANAKESAEELRQAHDCDALALQLDHRDPADVEAFARAAHGWKGRIDVLVNNAGGGATEGPSYLLDRDPAEIEDMVAVNLLGPLYCSRAIGRLMIEQGSGKIINIASVAGMVGRDRRMYYRNDLKEQAVDYAAAKAGVIGMSRDLAALLAPHGVQVNCISPGGFDKGSIPREFVEAYADETPLGRMGEMGRDLKGAVVFLASSASDYVTGENLVVDGGFVIWK